MGLEFSLPSTFFLPSPPSTPASRRSPKHHHHHHHHNHNHNHNHRPTPNNPLSKPHHHLSSPPPFSPDSSTLVNTLANRSDTPVARHVALARLAERLSAMAKSRRERVIRQLHISPDVLREVRKYTPSNSFSSIDEHDSDSDSLDGWTRPPVRPARASAMGGGGEKRERRRKGVSFAKYAEMRLFRE